MSQQRGATAQVVIGFESTFNTAPTDGFLLPVNSISINPTQNINSAATLTGSRNPVQPFRGNKDVSGTIVVPVDSVAMMYWLKALLGAATVTGASPYVHEYKIPSAVPSLTIETGFTDLTTDKYLRYTGCKVSTFDLSVGGDGELTASFGIIGSGFSIETSSFDATPTSVSLSRISNFQAAMTEGGSTASNVRMVSFKLDNDLYGDTYVLGASGTRGSLPEGLAKVSGQLTMIADDAAFAVLAKGIAATESAIKMTATAAASSIFEIEIQELEYSVSGVPVSGPQGLEVTLDYSGFYGNGSETSAFVARLTNTVTSPV